MSILFKIKDTILACNLVKTEGIKQHQKVLGCGCLKPVQIKKPLARTYLQAA
jgi:hypothetical protein